MLTQMHWAVLNVLSSAHRLFPAVTEILTLTHLRSIASLTAPGGRGLLVTDVVSNQTCRLEPCADGGDLRRLLQEIVEEERAIEVASPLRLSCIAEVDPVLERTAVLSEPIDVWLWENGPELVFLVYAMELRRRHPNGSRA
jgi:hypothetical protein